LELLAQAKFQEKSPIPLLGGARGGFIDHFFILITKSENHFGLSIIIERPQKYIGIVHHQKTGARPSRFFS